jgi:hypothetical protein
VGTDCRQQQGSGRLVAEGRTCRRHGGAAGRAGSPVLAIGAVHAQFLPDAASQC